MIDETEPIFAETARQMTITGDWVTPYFDGETRFDKPPLVYWLMAIFYKLIGVNEWAVRLPSALAAIALTVLCFYTLRYFGCVPVSTARRSQEKSFPTTQRQLWLSAWIGSAIVVFNLQTLIWAHQGVSDMLLSGCMGMALLCFFWGYVRKSKVKSQKAKGKRQKSEVRSQKLEVKTNSLFPILYSLFSIPNRWYVGFYVLSALAVLTKGPVGIVLPGFIILAFLFYVGKLRDVLQEMGLIGGGLIFLVIALPWYILVTLRNGNNFINSFFGYHNFDRFTEVVNGHAAPWYFYFLVVFIGFIPWSIYLPVAIARLYFWQRTFWCRQPRSSHLSLFALFWFTGIFLFFTISVTKLPSYVLPLIPAAAILVVPIWSEELTHYKLSLSQKKTPKNHLGLFISGIFNVLLLLALAVILIISPQLLGNDPAVVDLPQLVEESRLPWIGGIIWAVTALCIAFLLRRRQHWRWIILVNLIGFVAFFSFCFTPAFFLLDRARQLQLRELSE
ncbi:MAG: ArnT family glycosyltransferase, partial [Microcystaceae cyanobacterium]